jgi:Protein of unknown function (DUF3313)
VECLEVICEKPFVRVPVSDATTTKRAASKKKRSLLLDGNLPLWADIQNQRPTRTMATRNWPLARQSHNRQVTRAKGLPQLAFLSLLIICALVIGLIVRAQDSGTKQATDSREVSGFLGDYSGLVANPRNGDLLLYQKHMSVLTNYDKFILDRVTIYLLPEAQDRGIDPDDLERLAWSFHDAIAHEIRRGGRYRIVRKPGPGVLRLRAAITNVEPISGSKTAAPDSGAAAGSAVAAPGANTAFPRLLVGKVSIEGEMLDSVSGERMAAFMTSQGGRRWFSGFEAYKKWGDIESAFRSWAREFRERIDEAHGR